MTLEEKEINLMKAVRRITLVKMLFEIIDRRFELQEQGLIRFWNIFRIRELIRIETELRRKLGYKV